MGRIPIVAHAYVAEAVDDCLIVENPVGVNQIGDESGILSSGRGLERLGGLDLKCGHGRDKQDHDDGDS